MGSLREFAQRSVLCARKPGVDVGEVLVNEIPTMRVW